jgi:hypothetical protein
MRSSAEFIEYEAMGLAPRGEGYRVAPAGLGAACRAWKENPSTAGSL